MSLTYQEGTSVEGDLMYYIYFDYYENFKSLINKMTLDELNTAKDVYGLTLDGDGDVQWNCTGKWIYKYESGFHYILKSDFKGDPPKNIPWTILQHSFLHPKYTYALIKRGVDINIKDVLGRTARDISYYHNPTTITTILLSEIYDFPISSEIYYQYRLSVPEVKDNTYRGGNHC